MCVVTILLFTVCRCFVSRDRVRAFDWFLCVFCHPILFVLLQTVKWEAICTRLCVQLGIRYPVFCWILLAPLRTIRFYVVVVIKINMHGKSTERHSDDDVRLWFRNVVGWFWNVNSSISPKTFTGHFRGISPSRGGRDGTSEYRKRPPTDAGRRSLASWLAETAGYSPAILRHLRATAAALLQLLKPRHP